jgi:hypothetical protein
MERISDLYIRKFCPVKIGKSKTK